MSAGGWCRGCSRPATRCAAWRATPRGSQGRPWRDRVEVVAGDALAPATLAPALAGIDVAYYLIHSLGDRRGVRPARPRGGASLRRRGARCRRRTHHLPGRPGRPGARRSRTTCARGRRPATALRRGRRAGDRVPRRRHRRLGQPVVRDDPLPHRTRADHDLPALGLHAHAADRDPQRARLPRRRARASRERRADRSRSAAPTSSPTAR